MKFFDQMSLTVNDLNIVDSFLFNRSYRYATAASCFVFHLVSCVSSHQT